MSQGRTRLPLATDDWERVWGDQLVRAIDQNLDAAFANTAVTPAGGGTVTSVAVSGGATGLTTSGSPVTTSGTITLGGTLAIANGGTGATNASDARTNLGITGGGSVISVDVSGGTTGLTTSGGPITNSGTITIAGTLAIANGGTGAITAPAALTALGAAPIASPALTGTPTSTTAAVDTSTTQIATTAFVTGQASSVAPLVDGTAAAGTSLRYSRQDHVHPTDTTRAPLASPTFTGTVTIPAGASITGYATSGANSSITSLTGLTTPLSISQGGTGATNATDARTNLGITGGGSVISVDVSGGTTGLTTSGGPITNSGTITLGGTLGIASGGTSSTTAGGALTALGAAPLASPALTGTPTAPTATVDTNTTQLATTAFVVGQAATVAPLIDGTAAVGTSLSYARQDHIHPTDTTRAALASPALTGTPTSTTAAVDTSTTQIATTAFVTGQASAVAPLIDGTATVGTSLRYARQDHVHPTDTTRAALASPALTGTPTAPTAAVDTATTQIATTAFVVGQASAATPLVDGTAAIGTSLRYARQDHVHPTDTTRAPLASPTFTGTVTIPSGASIAGYATSGANSNITSLTGLTTPLSITQGGTGATNATDARTNLGITGGGSVTSVAVSGGTTGLTTSGGPITTSGTITLAGTLGIANGGTGATTAGSALTALGGAPLASPALTGTPTSTTAAADTSTTQIATTAFVTGQAASVAPLINGTAATGTSLRYARQDHVHPTDTTRAPLASPTFTGTVTIPSGASIAGYATSGANSSITSLSGLTTPLSVGQGGTGASSLTANNVLLGNGTSALQVVAPGTTGNVLTSNGTTWTSAASAAPTTGTAGYALTGNGASPATFQGFLQPGTGATTRTWQNKAADVVSVKDFGAVGNGSTDDTTAIQNALNTGKNVYLPSGRYLVTSGLSMTSSSQRMYGESGYGPFTVTDTTATAATIIEWGAPSDGTARNVITINEFQHCIIESITIRRSPGASNLTLGNGIAFNNSYFCEVRTCRITGTGNGVSMWGTGNQVIDCELRYFSGEYGIKYFGVVDKPNNIDKQSLRGVLERVVMDNGLYISGVSNATSAVVTTIFDHNLATGDTVLIEGIPDVNTAASGAPEVIVPYGGNGSWTVTVLTPTTFSIPWNSTVITPPGTIPQIYPGGGVVTSTSITFDCLLYDSYAHSLIVSACAFLWGGTAVRMRDSENEPYTPAEYSFPTWLHAFDLECDHQSNGSIILEGGEGCFITTSWIGANYNGSGILTTGNWRSELLVTNSRIHSCAQFGILLNVGFSSCISNNAIVYNSAKFPGLYAGIGVGSNASRFTITCNNITNDTSFLMRDPPGSSTFVPLTPVQGYGIYIVGNPTDYYQIVGNVINGNTVANISDNATSATNKTVQGYDTNGSGLSMTGNFIAAHVTPRTTNVYNLGNASYLWANVYAANGTIITSDPSLKTDISPLPMALPIIQDIDPVTFKWISGGLVPEKRITRKRLPILGTEDFTEEDVEETVYVDRPGKRTHWGFLASDVKAAFDKTGLDFGGYVKDEEGTEHLRPDQLIPVLWKAIQELKVEFDNYKKEHS